MNRNYYKLDFKLDEIRYHNKFDESTKTITPQALMAFFESNTFEEAIRLAISIGGDSDTIAAVTGSIAAEYYGIPRFLYDLGCSYLDQKLLDLLQEFESKYPVKIIEG